MRLSVVVGVLAVLVVVIWKKPSIVGTTLPLENTGLLVPADQFRKPPGSFVSVGFGSIHYVLKGTKDAPLVVFVHGFSGSQSLWEDYVNFFASKGYQALSYDLYGCGWSAAPEATYSLQFFVAQLEELLFKLSFTNAPIHLVGSSMGAAIVTQFTSIHPERVKSLTLISPAGLVVHKPPVANLVLVPLLADYLYPVLAETILVSFMSREFNINDLEREKVLSILKKDKLYQIKYNPSFLPTLLNTLRNFPMTDMRDAFATVGLQRIPTHLLMGENDKVTPFTNAQLIQNLIPRTVLHQFPNIGHYLFLQRPTELQQLMLQFFESPTAT